MGEPRAITFKEVIRSGGTIDDWHRIGEITGAGHVTLNSDGNASIDLTETSESVQNRVDALLTKQEEKAEEVKAEEAARRKEKSK